MRNGARGEYLGVYRAHLYGDDVRGTQQCQGTVNERD